MNGNRKHVSEKRGQSEKSFLRDGENKIQMACCGCSRNKHTEPDDEYGLMVQLAEENILYRLYTTLFVRSKLEQLLSGIFGRRITILF